MFGIKNVFCVASSFECLSAAIVGRWLGNGSALFVSFEHSRNEQALEEAVDAFAGLGGWKHVVRWRRGSGQSSDYFIDDKVYGRELASIRETIRSVDLTLRLREGCGFARVFVSCNNPYVDVVLGAMPACRRCIFPHGFDQPHKEDVSPGGWIETWRGPSVMKRVRQLYWRRGTPTLETWRRAYAASAGFEYAVTYSANAPDCAHTRLPPDFLQQSLRAAACLPSIADAVRNGLGSVDTSGACILLLQEVDEDRLGVVNRNRLEAYLHIMKAVARKVGVRHFYIKPHPRSAPGAVQDVLARLKAGMENARIEPLQIPQWLPTEVLLTARGFRCIASVASSTAPPWATPDATHFVSTCAGRLLDQGWSGRHPFAMDMEAGARSLVIDGVARDIDAEA